jgi:hypothetical protein
LQFFFTWAERAEISIMFLPHDILSDEDEKELHDMMVKTFHQIIAGRCCEW